MEKNFILGVDGGNTKTDYFLFDMSGSLVSYLREGTCSHEQMADSYEGTYRVMNIHIKKLLSQQGLKISDIKVGIFGLAGLDLPKQKENLEEVIRRIGIETFIAENDGFLGLKAGSESGAGVCSINGTGTVTAGIDTKGNRLQVGGVGYISGDDGGGAFIARELFREVYETLYRFGSQTKLIKPVFDQLNINNKAYYIQAIDQLYRQKFSHTPYIQLVLKYAEEGDEVALKIVNKVARALAKSTMGCINNLCFEKDDMVEIVLAGSVWVKPRITLLRDYYKEYVKKWSSNQCTFHTLEVPPATGAIFWGMEVALDKPIESSLKQRIIQEIEKIYK